MLAQLKERPAMANAESASASEKSERTVSRISVQLKGKNLIKRIGSKKTGAWKVF